jgi:hemerythrin-like domain-containing protein
MNVRHAIPVQDAIAVLIEDHKRVQSLFKQFEKVKQSGNSGADKARIVVQACMELTIHAQIEEEIFYPAVREAIGAGDLMDEAHVEHASAAQLIAQLQEMKPGDALYDATFTVLGDHISRHMREEQEAMFAQARNANVDLAGLGMRLQQRQQELKARYRYR